MIIVTSLAPNHLNVNNQKEAIKSWAKIGECYAMNNATEIERLQDFSECITFIETQQTVERLIGKPLVSINAMINLAKEKKEDLVLINSDIILSEIHEIKTDGLTIFSRHDYTEALEGHKIFEAGYDVFFIPNKFLDIYPPSIYSMGSPWWDYWICHRAIMSHIPLYYPQGNFASHKWHETQYNFQEWNWIGEYFRWEFKLNKQWTIPQLATISLERIKSHLIKI